MLDNDFLIDPALGDIAPPEQPKRRKLRSPIEVSRYQDVTILSKHPKVETINPGEKFQSILSQVNHDATAVQRILKVSPLLLHGEQHQNARALTRQIITSLYQTWTEAKIQQLCHQVLIRAAEKVNCDAHQDISLHLTEQFIFTDFDAPQADIREILTLSEFLAHQSMLIDFKLSEVIAIAEKSQVFIDKTTALAPHSKVLRSLSMSAYPDACAMLAMNIAPFTIALSHVISFAIIILSKHPQLVSKLQKHTDLINGFINECLRLFSVVRWTISATTHDDIQLSDMIMAKNTVFRCNLERGNRDPRIFAQAEYLNIKRKDPQILSFGYGNHACQGSPFTWRIMQTLIKILLSNYEIRVLKPATSGNSARGRFFKTAPISIISRA